MLLLLMFLYLRCFLLAWIILYHPCLMCDRLAVIYEYFVYTNTLYAPVCSEWVTYVCIRSFRSDKNYLFWFSHNIIIPNACASGTAILDSFGTSFLCSCGSLVYFL